MINNKKSVPILLVAASSMFTGCIGDIPIKSNLPLSEQILTFSFNQYHQDGIFIRNGASVSLGNPGVFVTHYRSSGDEVYVAFNGEKRLLEKEPFGLTPSPTISLIAFLSFDDIQPIPTTLIYAKLERDDVDIATGLVGELPEIPIYITPASNTTYTNADAIAVLWEINNTQPVTLVGFVTKCETARISNLSYSEIIQISPDSGAASIPVTTLLNAFADETITSSSCEVAISVTRQLTFIPEPEDIEVGSAIIYTSQINTRNVTINL